MCKKIIAIICLSLTALSAQAAQEYKTHTAKFAAQIGLTFGGDELAEAEVDGWGADYDDSVDAGGGALMTIGALFELRRKPIDIQMNVGLHFDQLYGSDDNDEIVFSRGVFEVLSYYRKGKHRIGGGLTYHANPEFEFDVDGVFYLVEFENQLAPVFEYRYMFNEMFALGGRYVVIDYQDKNSSAEVDGNYLGIMFSVFF